MMTDYRNNMFTEKELEEIRKQFHYVDRDRYDRKRLFFDNAGGSLRLKKAEDDWEIGSPATAQFAAVTEIINYVAALGQKTFPEETDRRKLFETGMRRISDHERGLLDMMLEGFDDMPGLRYITGVTVQMDGRDLSTRDLILGIEFLNLSCQQAVAEYERHGVITFERALTSIYSRRMVEAFDSKGMVRLSPLHVNTPAEIRQFLLTTQEIAKP